MSVEIEVQPLDSPRLVTDHLAGSGSVRRFLPASPTDLAAFRERADDAARRFGREERRAVAELLQPLADEGARKLQRFVHEGGVMVTTGQQPGLFGGPAYTLNKPLAASKLAQTLENRLGITVLPVFWIASDDHDWTEANHLYLTTANGELRRLGLPDDELPVPLSERTLPAGIGPLREELCRELAAHGRRRIKGVAGYRPGASAAAAFTELMRSLLEGTGLFLVNGADPLLKGMGRRVLQASLQDSQDHQERLSERTRELEGQGYQPQVSVLEGGANLFLRTESGRERLFRFRGGWLARASGERFTDRQLLDVLLADPGRFSPNVLLRPVVEAEVLPTIAYLGGPAEVSYLAQAAVLFERCGVPQPVVVPRPSLTLVEAGVRREVESLGLSLDRLSEPPHELAMGVARRLLPEPVASALAELRVSVGHAFELLIERGRGEIDPTLAGPLGAARNRALLEVARAEKKALGAVKRVHAAELQTLDRVLAQLRPLGEPQERVVSILPYLARHGPGLLSRILERTDFPLA